MYELILVLIGGFISYIGTTNTLKKQIHEERTAFLSLQNHFTQLKNIGSVTAINISLYRAVFDLSKDSFIGTNRVNISLIETTETLTKDEVWNISCTPIGHFNTYIIQFQSLNGDYYQQIYKISSGRGDAPVLKTPTKVKKIKHIAYIY